MKILKKSTHLQCDKWRDICSLPVVAKIIPKLFVEQIAEHLESFIDRKQASFRSQHDLKCSSHESFRMNLIAITRATYHGADFHVLHRSKISKKFQLAFAYSGFVALQSWSVNSSWRWAWCYNVRHLILQDVGTIRIIWDGPESEQTLRAVLL